LNCFENKQELRDFLQGLKKQHCSVGFVPTMGALHAGHISLVAQSNKENDVTVVSIFVNPTQFNDKQDLINYPVSINEDLFLLKRAKCEIVFIPKKEEIYPNGNEILTYLDFGHLDRILEGKYRPGHFYGVATVVSKLFDIVQPDRAYFGEKDYQQYLIIKKLVEIQNRKIDIVHCPIIREKDGLAMSSRNILLTTTERAAAPLLYRVLIEARNIFHSETVDESIKWAKDQFDLHREFQLEYFDILNGENLKPLTNGSDHPHVIGLVAALLGNVRLIDNMRF